MSSFMDKSKYTVDYIFFIVGQDIWVTCKATCTEGAASLSLVFISVDPSFLQEAFAEGIRVIFSKWHYSFSDDLYSLFICMPAVCSRNYRYIYIPMLELIFSKKLGSQCIVAV